MPVKVFHTVLLKTVEGLDPAEIAEVVPQWRDHILRVPGVESAYLGPIHSPDPQGYSHMVHIVLESPEAAAAFGPHPEHLATMPLLEGKLTSFLIADLHTPG